MAGGSVHSLGRMMLGEALSLLFPPRCVSCGDFESLLCEGCRAGLEPLGETGCRRCGGPLGRGLQVPYCSECLVRPPAFVSARSAFLYRGAARDLVTALKGGGRRSLGGLMARLAAPAFLPWLAAVSESGPVTGPASDQGGFLLTWVPAHRSVERRRGYNQAEVFARALAGLVPGARTAELVRKVGRTPHQQGLDRRARAANLGGAFVLTASAGRQAEAKGVVLVDDVYTTGATTNEVAALLRGEAGAPVYVFTFCRTPLAAALTVD